MAEPEFSLDEVLHSLLDKVPPLLFVFLNHTSVLLAQLSKGILRKVVDLRLVLATSNCKLPCIVCLLVLLQSKHVIV